MVMRQMAITRTKSSGSTGALLASTVPGTREMVSNAAGVLVFPAVVGGSFVVGAEHGRGALRVGGAGHDQDAGADQQGGGRADGQRRGQRQGRDRTKKCVQVGSPRK